MPDILIQCPECSREYKVSEYATVDNMKCVTCGAGLSRPSAGYDSGLAPLRLKGAGRPPKLAGVVPALPDVPDALAIAGGPVVYAAPMVNVHHTEEVQDARRWVAYVVALFVLGALVGFQYYSKQLESYLTYYIWARNGLAIGSYGLVVLLAFQDHFGPGLVCLFIPPYALFYTATSIESGILRGVFYGMMLVMVAEVYFLPDHSALLAVAELVNALIRDVDGLILKASESPI